MSQELDAINALAANFDQTAVILSPESVAVLFYALEGKKNPVTWLTDHPDDEMTSDDREAIQDMVDVAFDQIIKGATMFYPTNAIVFPPQWLASEGADIIYVPAIGIDIPFNVVGGITVFETGKGIHFDVVLETGVYLVTMWGLEGTSNGILDWYIDGSLFAEGQDWYAAADGSAYRVAGFVVGESGRHTVNAEIAGKNELSSDYAFGLAFTSMVKTS